MEEYINSTKKRIMSVAIELIKVKGYDKVTVNDICGRAEISKNTFYYYFKSKEDVLLAYRFIPRELDSLKLVELLKEDSYLEKYWQTLEPALDFFVNAGVQIVRQIYILNLSNDIGTFVKPKKDHIIELQEELLKKAQQAGEIRNTAHPKELIQGVFLMIIGSVLFWCISGENIDYKNNFRSLVETFFDVPQEQRKSVCRKCPHPSPPEREARDPE